MSDSLPERPAQQGEGPRALRILGLAAVCSGVAALAAGTFVLSYPGVHAIALQAGISPRLARGYPLLADAMLIVVLAAVLSLRGAGWPSKILAWLTLLALLAGAAAADALHAAKGKLPARQAEIGTAVLPWVLVFLAFVLLLAMLRHARMRRVEAVRARIAPADEAPPGAGGQELARQPATAPAIVPGLRTLSGQAVSADAPSAGSQPVLSMPRQPGPSFAADDDAYFASPLGAAGPEQADLAIDAELSPDDPSSDETALGPAPVEPDATEPDTTEPEATELDATEPEATEHEATEPEDSQPDDTQPDQAEPDDTQPDQAGPDQADPAFGMLSPAPTAAAEEPDPGMPVFHRISSSPTPPAGG
jgi:hypothetical protein